MDHKVDAELMNRQRNMLRSQGEGYIPPGGHRHSKSFGGTKTNTANQSVMSMSKRPTRLPGLSMDQGQNNAISLNTHKPFNIKTKKSGCSRFVYT